MISNTDLPAVEMDEETALALAVTIDNHIEVMRTWQRKLRQPYLPTQDLMFHPKYPKPALNVVTQVRHDATRFYNSITRLIIVVRKARQPAAEAAQVINQPTWG